MRPKNLMIFITFISLIVLTSSLVSASNNDNYINIEHASQGEADALMYTSAPSFSEGDVYTTYIKSATSDGVMITGFGGITVTEDPFDGTSYTFDGWGIRVEVDTDDYGLEENPTNIRVIDGGGTTHIIDSSPSSDTWYKVEFIFGSGTGVTVKVYSLDGSELGSVSTTTSSYLSEIIIGVGWDTSSTSPGRFDFVSYTSTDSDSFEDGDYTSSPTWSKFQWSLEGFPAEASVSTYDTSDPLYDFVPGSGGSSGEAGLSFSSFDGLTTNLSLYNQTELSNFSGLVLEKTGFGKIEWNNPVNAYQDFDSNVDIGQNYIYVDSASLNSTLNSSANLSFYNVEFDTFEVYKDGEVCGDCVVEREGNTVNVQVNGFSNYSIDGLTLYIEELSPSDGGKVSSFPITLSAKLSNNQNKSMNSTLIQRKSWNLSDYNSYSSLSGLNGNINFQVGDNGTKLFLSDGSLIYQYNCSSPWNISSCVYSGINDSFGESDIFYFGDNGNKLYSRVDSIILTYFSYDCETPWDISNCTSSSNNFPEPSGDGNVKSMFLSEDGTNLYFAFSGGEIKQFPCSIGWNLSSCSTSGVESKTTQSSVVNGMYFNRYGDKLYHDDGNSSVFRYDCSEKWNVSTCEYIQNITFDTDNVDDIVLKPFGSRMYLMNSTYIGEYLPRVNLSTYTNISNGSVVTHQIEEEEEGSYFWSIETEINPTIQSDIFSFEVDYINTCEEFMNMTDGTYHVSSDIDCSGYNFTKTTQQGNLTIKGNDHTIYNITTYGTGGIIEEPSNTYNLNISDLRFENINVTSSVGTAIFEVRRVILDNLTFHNAYVKSDDEAGIVTILDYNGVSSYKNITITDSYIEGQDSVGGLVGRTYGNVEYKNILIKNTTVSGRDMVGGFFGQIRGRNSDVESQTFIGDVEGRDMVGGFFGRAFPNSYKDDARTENTYINVTVNATGDEVGGFGGRIYVQAPDTDFFRIIEFMVYGKVYGNNDVGGLVGTWYRQRNRDSTARSGIIRNKVYGNNNVGGFVGKLYQMYDDTFTISSTEEIIFLSEPQGNSNVGSIVGEWNVYSGGTSEDIKGFSHTYIDKNILGRLPQVGNDDTEPVSNEYETYDLVEEASYPDYEWYFGTLFEIVENESYPYLLDKSDEIGIPYAHPIPPKVVDVNLTVESDTYLIGRCQANEKDSVNVTYEYNLLVNNVTVESGTTNETEAGELVVVANHTLTEPGNATLYCNATDETDQTSITKSLEYEIPNLPPFFEECSIISGEKKGDDFVAYGNATDFDNDNITYQYKFLNADNNVTLRNFSSSDTYTGCGSDNECNKYDEIKVECKAITELHNTTNVSEVRDIKDTVSELNITPEEGKHDKEANITFDFYDIDGDVYNYSCYADQDDEGYTPLYTVFEDSANFGERNIDVSDWGNAYFTIWCEMNNTRYKSDETLRVKHPSTGGGGGTVGLDDPIEDCNIKVVPSEVTINSPEDVSIKVRNNDARETYITRDVYFEGEVSHRLSLDKAELIIPARDTQELRIRPEGWDDIDGTATLVMMSKGCKDVEVPIEVNNVTFEQNVIQTTTQNAITGMSTLTANGTVAYELGTYVNEPIVPQFPGFKVYLIFGVIALVIGGVIVGASFAGNEFLDWILKGIIWIVLTSVLSGFLVLIIRSLF